MEKQIFIFLGLPASGKGTQTELLAKNIGGEVIGMGNLIRNKIASGDQNYDIEAMIKTNDAGIPQPDEIANRLVGEVLEKNGGSLIFDNFPFTPDQAEYFDKKVSELNLAKPKLVYIKIDPETAIKRISTRYICKKCGNIEISEVEKPCAKCGEMLTKRADDTEEAVRTRISKYVPNIERMLEYYKGKIDIYEIDGEKSIEEVEAQIEKIYR